MKSNTLYIIISTAMLISGLAACSPTEEERIFFELSAITEDFARPTLRAKEILPVLRKIEHNENEHIITGRNQRYGIRQSITLLYWDWNLADQAWVLLKDFKPDIKYQSCSLIDLAVYLGILNHVDEEEMHRMLDAFQSADQETYLSKESVSALLKYDFLPSFKELNSRYRYAFDTNAYPRDYRLNFAQKCWIDNATYLIRAYSSVDGLYHNDASLKLLGELTSKIYSLFSHFPYENNMIWVEMHYDLMYSMIWVSYNASKLNCPPKNENNLSIWTVRFKKIKDSYPDTARKTFTRFIEK